MWLKTINNNRMKYSLSFKKNKTTSCASRMCWIASYFYYVQNLFILKTIKIEWRLMNVFFVRCIVCILWICHSSHIVNWFMKLSLNPQQFKINWIHFDENDNETNPIQSNCHKKPNPFNMHMLQMEMKLYATDCL